MTFPDGWFHTGDIGTMSKEGYISLVDRTKDLIKSAGEWISSIDLENAIMEFSKVLEAAVISLPDEKWQEWLMACISCLSLMRQILLQKKKCKII